MKTKTKDLRLAALIRFATAITILNLFGHFFLGFEQSWAHPLAALATTYTLEILFETFFAYLYNKTPRYKGGFLQFVYFLLPAHITGLAVSMLLFTNERLTPIIFAAAVAILSKSIFRININGHSRHFLNPSNAGIAVILLLFPWVGIAPPYQFSENIEGAPDWILPCVFIVVGSFLNINYTKKMPLILAWLGGFFLQAVVRSMIWDTPIMAGLLPVSGIAFLLFTFYMVSDPATTPLKSNNQIFFGLGVAATYGIMLASHIVFTLFFSLFFVSILRGAYFWILDIFKKEEVSFQYKTTELVSVAPILKQTKEIDTPVNK